MYAGGKTGPLYGSRFDLPIPRVDTEELLITIAGRDFFLPLPKDLLQKNLKKNNPHCFIPVNTAENKKTGHAEPVLAGDNMYRIDKPIISEASGRGKGYRRAIINALLKHAYDEPGAQTVEQDVFDWNTAGIKCYENGDFVINPAKQAVFMPVTSNGWR